MMRSMFSFKREKLGWWELTNYSSPDLSLSFGTDLAYACEPLKNILHFLCFHASQKLTWSQVLFPIIDWLWLVTLFGWYWELKYCHRTVNFLEMGIWSYSKPTKGNLIVEWLVHGLAGSPLSSTNSTNCTAN